MNKEQRRIFLLKILPKFLILAIMLGGGITYLVMNAQYHKNERKAEDNWKRGFHEKLSLKSKTEHSSIVINNTKLLYPKSYSIKGEYGTVETGGSYVLINYVHKDELTINYTPKEIVEGVECPTTLNDEVKQYASAVVSTIKKSMNLTPVVSKVRDEMTGNYSVMIQEINYADKTLFIYGFQTKKEYFVMSSRLDYLLNGIIETVHE